ncbi:hypothetical protein A3C25_06425 [Candidatus Roizmanbacteria bacterium RIFCSPHIGHO2_02_FULL_38_11]|uniref:Uncharacterized protein n=1 Tax=Candidatus Roizmanbacteria bacterium RIFCSPHIGHO2_02_FULL_38_11 TaxID=1802039 RepID=A0A1F7GWZ1_9BACT|nr:MAG: hypothetical protein A3C25_06425 [Candidatus Roizmanbacteria bacterium RIFCSPHIGHO2_02_FULL_38_11]
MKISTDIKENLKKYLNELLKNEKEKVTLVSANALNDEEMSALYKYIPRLKESQIDFAINKNVIAGVLIKIRSKVFDLTLKGQLNNLKNHMYEVD